VTGTAGAALAWSRYTRVQAAMARREVGALLLATPHLGAFASGARRVQMAGSGGSLPWVVVAAGAASPVVFTTDPDGAPSWMPRTSVLPLHWDRERQLARIGDLLAAAGGPVACDVWSPAVRALVERLGRPLVDASPVLALAAGGRTAEEIAAIGDALAAARAGLAAAAAAVRPGASPRALLAAASAAMSGAGAGFPLSEGVVSRITSDAERRLGPAETLVAGDVVTLGWGVHRAGHAGVGATTVGCGSVDLAPRRRRWLEALCALAAACRAGETTDALCAAARAAGASATGLLAHGLGVGIEPPFVALDDAERVALVPGTVLVLAPVVEGYRATRALVVGERSARWLEPAP
jgi:Xaa-Pro aminopeptidase